MSDFIKMDLFFIVTTGSVILISAFMCLILWRIARILKNIDHICDQASQITDRIRANRNKMRFKFSTWEDSLKLILDLLGIRGKGVRDNKK